MTEPDFILLCYQFVSCSDITVRLQVEVLSAFLCVLASEPSHCLIQPPIGNGNRHQL